MYIKILAIIVSTLFLSCKIDNVYNEYINGSGTIVEATVEIDSFVKLDISLWGKNHYYRYPQVESDNIYIKLIDSTENFVKLKTDENILENLKVEDNYGTLVITNQNEYDRYKITILEIEIHTSELSKVNMIYNNIPNCSLEVIGVNEFDYLQYTFQGFQTLILPEEMTIKDTLWISEMAHYSSSPKTLTISGLKKLYTNDFFTRYTGLIFHNLTSINSNEINISIAEALDNLTINSNNAYIVNENYTPVKIEEINVTNDLTLDHTIDVNKICGKNILLKNNKNINSIYAEESITLYGTSTSSGINIKSLETDHLEIMSPQNISLETTKFNKLSISGAVKENFNLNDIGSIKELNVDLRSGELTLSGNVESLFVNLLNDNNYLLDTITIFEGSKLISNNCDITLNSRSKAFVNAKDSIIYNLSGDSELHYRGIDIPYISSSKESTSSIFYLGEIQ